jgi:hypothetical protein
MKSREDLQMKSREDLTVKARDGAPRLKLAAHVFAASILALVCAAGTALAAEPVKTDESRETCAAPQIEQPFRAFDDFRDYVLAPGGSFEDPSAPGWRLDGGAAVGVGNDPFNVRGGNDMMSLALPAGASATSPAMCVDLHWPTMRFVGFQEDEHDAELDVEVLYPEVETRRKGTSGTRSRRSRRSARTTGSPPRTSSSTRSAEASYPAAARSRFASRTTVNAEPGGSTTFTSIRG